MLKNPKLSLLTMLFLAGYALPLYPSWDIKNAGGRSRALGNTSVVFTDIFSARHNQAGLAHLDQIALGLYGESIYMVPGLHFGGIVFALPTTSGTFGADISFSGDRFYQQVKCGIGFGKKLSDDLSAGIQLDYLRQSVAEYGVHNSFTFELGVRYRFLEKFHLAAHYFNPFHARAGETGQGPPAILTIGGMYNADDQLRFTIEIEKYSNKPIAVKGGLEYEVHPKINIRLGSGSSPVLWTMGAGYLLKDYMIDLAFAYHQQLGISPHISLTYVIKNNL